MWLKLTQQPYIVGPAHREHERKLRTSNFLLSKMVKLLIHHLYSPVLGENLLMWSYLLVEKWDSIRTLIHWMGVWKPFLLWASVLSKDTKKNLRSYLLQESLLLRKEITSRKELDSTENTQGKNRENTSGERWVSPRGAISPEGLGYRAVKAGHLHIGGVSLIDSLHWLLQVIYQGVLLCMSFP